MKHDNQANILLVDDEPIGIQLLEAIFFSEGYWLYFANNGEDALKKIEELVPDVVLLDIMMPGMDGMEVCRRVRENPATGFVPVILITALDDRDTRLKGLESGANDYITKPFDRNEVLLKVRNILSITRGRP